MRHDSRLVAADPVQARGSDSRRAEPDTRRLLQYLRGWAEAKAATIAEAVSPDYRFVDPMVGCFDRHTLDEYFAALRRRVALDRAGIYLALLATQPASGGLRLWRTVPACGLSGVADLQFAGELIRREVVSYDLSIATELLRRGDQSAR